MMVYAPLVNRMILLSSCMLPPYLKTIITVLLVVNVAHVFLNVGVVIVVYHYYTGGLVEKDTW